jgi:signal transduction histidine kinase
MTQALVFDNRLAALVCEAVDTLSEGFAILGPDHKVIYANAPSWAHHGNAYRMYDRGLTIVDAVSAGVRRFNPSLDDAAVRSTAEKFAARLLAGKPTDLVTDNGRIARTIYCPMANGFIVAVSTDITELREREAELKEARLCAEAANRAKSEFLATMSHELRTPLNAILGFSEIIKDEIMGAAPARYVDYAKDIHASGRHLLALINDVLDVSKLEAGKFELHESDLDVMSVVSACLVFVKPQADAAGIIVAEDHCEVLPALRADERLLKQVLLNVLSNAVKFTPRGGSVTVSTSWSANGGLEITIADTGIGMSDSDIAIALSAFGQVDSRIARQHQGTGLGLPIARSLMRLHGGELSVQSAPDRGTTVTILFPQTRLRSVAA